MTQLRPFDVFEIQSAIDQYERRFPRRAAPSAEVALAWRLGKRDAGKRAASQSNPDLESGGENKPDSEYTQQECSRLVWAWEAIRLQWHIWRVPKRSAGLLLLLGWWGVVAALTATFFLFGAIVGGFIMRSLGFAGQNGFIDSILVAVIGAAILTLVLRLVTRGRVLRV